MTTRLARRAALATAAALIVLGSAPAGNAASLTLGTSNTSNASTTLTGGTAGGPELKVVNKNTTQPALLGQGTGGAAGAFGIFGVLTTVSPGAASAAVRGQNNATNGQGYGVWGSQAGSGVGVYGTTPTGVGVYGKHTGGGTAAAVRGDSASGAASAFSIYGLLTAAGAGSSSAAVRGENKGTNANGSGVWGSQAGSGVGVYGTSPLGVGVSGQHTASTGTAPGVAAGTSSNDNGATALTATISPSIDTTYSKAIKAVNNGGDFSSMAVYGSAPYGTGVWGDGGVIGTGVYGSGFFGVEGVNADQAGSGVAGSSISGNGVLGDAQSSGGSGVLGRNTSGPGVKGTSNSGIGVRGESTNFQGVSGYSVNNAGVYGAGYFAGYFDGPLEQHGNLNTYDSRVNVSNGQARIVHGGTSFADTSAALNAEQEGKSGEAAWLHLTDASNTNAVLMLIKQATGTGDFLKCFNQSGPGSYAQVCHVSADGTFVDHMDFAESLPVRGRKAQYQPGDVLSISRTRAGQVVKSSRPRDPALIGVYSTRPGFLGADAGNGITRVGKDEVPVAITGIVPVKVTAQNGSIRPGDLLTSSSAPGRAMRAGTDPPVGTVLGKSLGFLTDGQGVIKMLVMQR